MKGCSVLMIWAIVLCALATGPPLLAQSHTLEPDRAALTAPKLGRRRVTAGKAFESADHCAAGPKTDQT